MPIRIPGQLSCSDFRGFPREGAQLLGTGNLVLRQTESWVHGGLFSEGWTEVVI